MGLAMSEKQGGATPFHCSLPNLMPIPAPSLFRIGERDELAADGIKIEAARLGVPMADLLAALALDGWRARKARAAIAASGPGRLIGALQPDQRAAALAALDALTRPMSIREIDRALIGRLSRSGRRDLLAALKPVRIIAIIEEEEKDG